MDVLLIFCEYINEQAYKNNTEVVFEVCISFMMGALP